MTKNVKYPGKLGVRSNDVIPPPPARTALGAPSEKSEDEYKKAKSEWVQRQVFREFDGIMRLMKHYEIKESTDQYLRLALALARDHVPYCMPPNQGKGRPKKTQSFLPVIDAMAKVAKSVGKPQTAIYEQFAELLNVKTETIVREVKRFRSKSKGGEIKK